VRARLAALNMQTVRDDVSPFLERPQDAALLTRENFEGLLRDESFQGKSQPSRGSVPFDG
jgi:hypothetical protein